MLTVHAYQLNCEFFTETGKFDDYTIYKSYSVPIEGIAYRLKNCICVYSHIYEVLRKSPHFIEYLTAICEHEIKYPEFHTDCKRTKRDMEVLVYIQKEVGLRTIALRSKFETKIILSLNC